MNKYIQSGVLGFIILLSLYSNLVGQSASKERQFFNYTVSDGLPSMEIYDILQDQKGYIWLGTEAGLCRFDGHRFNTYTTKDGLPNNDVLDIEEDHEGRIWINAFGPLAYFEQGSFEKYDLNLRYIHAGIDLVPNGLGEYWINYGGQVFIIDSVLQLIHQTVPEHIFDTQFHIYRLFKQDDKVWIVNRNALYQFEGRQLIEEIPIQFPDQNMDGFHGIEYNGFIYYTSNSGIVAIDYKSESKEQWIVFPELTEANQLKIIDNDLWLVSSKKGVFQFKGNADGSLSLKKRLLSEESPTEVLKDVEGNLWVTSYGKGLFFLPINADKFKIIDFPDNEVASKLESVIADDDLVVVGTLKGKLRFLQEDGKMGAPLTVSESNFLNRIIEIKRLPSGALLLGTDRGLWRWTPQSSILIHPLPIKNIFMHKDGRVLFNNFRETLVTT